jgi:hypothetical protein
MFHDNCSYYNIVYIGQLGIFCGQNCMKKLHITKGTDSIFKKIFIQASVTTEIHAVGLSGKEQ